MYRGGKQRTYIYLSLTLYIPNFTLISDLASDVGGRKTNRYHERMRTGRRGPLRGPAEYATAASMAALLI